MTIWRLAALGLLGGVVLLPLLAPLADLWLSPSAGWDLRADTARIGLLAWNTLWLVVGVVGLSLPIGCVLAVVLYRTDLPAAAAVRAGLLVSVFVPLPLYATSWQAAFGSGRVIQPADPTSPWHPWVSGLLPAVWIHAVAGLPWVVLIVGTGLTWVERHLEEDALLAAAAWPVIRHVTFPRAGAAVWAAAAWVTVQSATEITVTDMMQYRTFAEEIYTQLVVGDTGAIARSVAVNLPLLVLAGGLGAVCLRRLERRVPPAARREPPLLFELGGWRWPVFVLTLTLILVLDGIPVAGLVWRAGVSGWPESWSAATVGAHLARSIMTEYQTLAKTLTTALAAGVLTASAALILAWLALDSRWFRLAVTGVLILGWVWPGPLVGLGLKTVIGALVDRVDSAWLAWALYDGPSPVPVMWAQVIRLLPYAVALLWPALRAMPVELREALRVDGGRPSDELIALVAPLVRGPAVAAAGAVTILALGELGASKLVCTPGWETFAHHIFALMHYGVTNDLAALCLIVLAVVAAAAMVARARPEAR